MIRRFNSTGRIRLPKNIASISVQKDDNGILYFNASVDLTNQSLPSEAEVYLEAYYKNSYMRFPMGKVGNMDPARHIRYNLTEIQSDYVYFRLKVVDPAGKTGKLFAQADKIRPTVSKDSQSTRTSLLGVHFTDDLGERIWELNLDEVETYPILEINAFSGNPAITEFVHHRTEFRSLVYPEVVEKVIRHIYDDQPESEEADEWKYKWLEFVTSIPGIDPPPKLGTNDEPDSFWYGALREHFSKRLDLKKLFARDVLTLEDFND